MKKTPTFHFHILAISTILFSLLLGSCTVYYSTPDIKKTFRESQKELNKVLGKIAKQLEQLKGILTSIGTDQKTLGNLIQQFENEVGEEPMIWSGPGMHSHSILADMKELGDKTSAQVKKFNKLASSL